MTSPVNVFCDASLGCDPGFDNPWSTPMKNKDTR